MQPLALLPPSVELSVDGVALSDSTVTLLLRTTSATADCPLCGRPARHVHSRYCRSIADLPYQGRATTLHLTARKFLCKNDACPRSVFCERLPDLAPKHARSTTRLVGIQRAVGLALGGKPGCCLADEMGMPTSATTLLRRVKQAASKPVKTPRVLGVDDWAWRKGLRYGTILVDLERGEVIDLLPSRDGDALKQWLLEHPGVEVISRDRATAYAQAASEAAPAATQVADRWHLLKNVREMLERFFEHHRGQIKAVASDLAQPLARQQPVIETMQLEEAKEGAEAAATAPPKQRHTAMQVFRRLQSEHAYKGSYDQVRRHIQRHRRKHRETFIPLAHDLSGRADDSGAAGPADAPLPDLRDERRKLPLPRVDVGKEEQEGRVSAAGKAKARERRRLRFQGMAPVSNGEKEQAPDHE